MARTVAPKVTALAQKGSLPTNLFWPCQANVKHPQLPVAARIMKGPKAFHTECGACHTRTILAPGLWTDADGMTRAQAQHAGLVVLG